MVTKFERSGILFKPQVYHSFVIKSKSTNELEEYFVQDLPQHNFEEAAKFMIDNFAEHETFQHAIKLSKPAMLQLYRFVFQQKVSIACYNKNSGKLVAVNALTVKSKGDNTSFEVKIKLSVF